MRTFLSSGLGCLFCNHAEIPDLSVCRKTCDVVRAIVTGATGDRAPSQAGPVQGGRRDSTRVRNYCVLTLSIWCDNR